VALSTFSWPNSVNWFERTASSLAPKLIEGALDVLGALLILVAGIVAARSLASLTSRLLARSPQIDPTVRTFAASGIRYLTIAVTLLAVLGKFGVQTASLVALIGAAGLAIGLALQGALSDVAAGVVLLIVRPFRVGHFVQAANLEGSVQAVTLFTTELTTLDNRKIIIPNSKVWGVPIINYSALGTRRLDLPLRLTPQTALETTLASLEAVLHAQAVVLAEPAPRVEVKNLTNAVELIASAWVRPEHIATARTELYIALKAKLDAQGLTLHTAP
jgi:small conductance mechanosensitive channel